jgi:SOS response regulatory protein OraA/RecX
MMLLGSGDGVQVLQGVLKHWFAILGALVIVGIVIVESVKYATSNWRRAREAQLEAGQLENEAKLKALMLQQGMPPEEIERVLASGSGALSRKRGETQLEELMIENGIPADQIARVLKARKGEVSDVDAEAQVVETLVKNDYKAEHIEKVLAGARSHGKINDDAVRLVKIMAENWMKAEDIERVLRAQRAGQAKTIDIKAALADAGVAANKADKVLRAVQSDDDEREAPTRSA